MVPRAYAEIRHAEVGEIFNGKIRWDGRRGSGMWRDGIGGQAGLLPVLRVIIAGDADATSPAVKSASTGTAKRRGSAPPKGRSRSP